MESQSSAAPAEPDQSSVLLELPLVLHGGRRAPAGTTGVCVLLGVLSLWMYRDDAGWPVLFASLFFLVVALLAGLTALYPASLRIDEQGFSIRSGWRKGGVRSTPWSHIERFDLKIVAHRRSIVYQVTAGSGRRRLPGGYVFPGHWRGISATHLAELLEACRMQFTAGTTTSR